MEELHARCVYSVDDIAIMLLQFFILEFKLGGVGDTSRSGAGGQSCAWTLTNGPCLVLGEAERSPAAVAEWR